MKFVTLFVPIRTLQFLHTSLYGEPFLLHIHTAHDLAFNWIY